MNVNSIGDWMEWSFRGNNNSDDSLCKQTIEMEWWPEWLFQFHSILTY